MSIEKAETTVRSRAKGGEQRVLPQRKTGASEFGLPATDCNVATPCYALQSFLPLEQR